MKKLSSQEIRETWLNFFKSKGHHIEPGANLIPHDDPTLLWINSGVAALKKYFDGSEIPPAKRITNVQKSIRTNDIDNVGKTARHHTFFEMLGNFSIGDYFRKEVIPWAYEILTSESNFGMPKDKIYVTYNPDDLETKKLWIECGLEESHLIPLEGNFWQIGEGPCGPNTEVFFDRGEKYDPDHLGIKLLEEELENDRYVEIWGIVFSQYNAENGVDRKDYKELPSKNIDTGAGLERITCILQGTDTNFETDLFWPIIEEIEKISGKKYEDNKMAFRVIADHIRTCTFAIADGEFFSNEGRGYVLRRLLRRALRYGMQLGIKTTFLYNLVPTVVNVMKNFYTYLPEKQDFVIKLVKIEEEKFIKTLRTGEQILNEYIENNGTVTGKDAFKLYDTYGFPFELTEEICEEHSIHINKDEFDKLMEEQKLRAKNARNMEESMNKQSIDLMNFTDNSEFSYSETIINSKVIGCFKDGKKVDSISDEGYIIVEKTPFYAEMGGQIYDQGVVLNDNFEADVIKVSTAPNKQHLHQIVVKFGEIKVGDNVELKINENDRREIESNHSATHLLHAALSQVLGEHVDQKGSFVCKDYLRFDFSYLGKLSNDQLAGIEKLVNEKINECIEEKTLVLNYDDAVKTGAEHEFGEKYGDIIRVVTFDEFSKEFCGGTHVKNSKDIGLFIIQSEESIAAGVRRITAVTGKKAYEMVQNRNKLSQQINAELNISTQEEALDRVKKLNADMSLLKKNIEELSNEIAKISADNLTSKIQKYSGSAGIFEYLSNLNRDQLTKVSDYLKQKFENGIFVLIGKKNNDSYPVVVSVSRELSKTIPSASIMKTINSVLGGNGGGRPELSYGSVKNLTNLDEAKNKFEELLK